MAQLVTSGQMSATLRAAANADHASVSGGFPHNDGPEWSNADTPVEQALAGPSPTTATQAAALILAAKTFINAHMAFADLVSGDKIFSHNVADGANTLSASMDAWSVIETNLREACRLLLNEESDDYEKHRLNTGGTFHTTVDTVNYLGVPVTLASGVTDQQLVDRANLLKALLSDHVVKVGGTHTSADSSNVVTAVNAIYDATTGMDWDKMILLVNDVRTKYEAHRVSGGIHAANDTVNTITLGAVAMPAGWNTLLNEILVDWDVHVQNATFHNFADTDNMLSLGAVSTVAAMITAAQSIYSKVNAHARAAPKSRAYRLQA